MSRDKTPKTPLERRLSHRLGVLEAQNKQLVNAAELRGQAIQNSLSSLVQAGMAQTNLTSFNPILTNNIYAPLSLNWTLLMYMYKTHGIIQTAIDEPVLDAFRGGIELTSKELDPDDLAELQTAIEDSGILQEITSVIIWARLFGGAGLVINTEADPSQPLEDADLRGRVAFYDATRWELGAPYKDADFYDFYGKRLHNSRVLTFSGKRAPWIIRRQLAGWGWSEIERMVEDFNLYIKTRNVLYEILDEAKLDIYHLQGLNAQLLSAAGTDQVQTRVQLTNQLKNFNNALLLDKEDEYEQKQMTFSGIAEIMKENRIGIASALRMPLTKLFGLSAQGFDSGETDLENYNAMVESEVREPARPLVRKSVGLLMRAKFGKEYQFSYKHQPLRVLGAKEEEEVKRSKQERVLALYDHSLLDSKEVGQIAAKDGLVDIETKMEQGLLEDHPAMAEMPGMGGPEDGDGGADDAGDKPEPKEDDKPEPKGE